ncbi:conserved hypothetical protein [Candidatus Nitrotoga sp. HW29]|uniref:hypothetical protein n=1 Tax=Candidatus Nitrotoga sp. HW29 TaxID=2886963 RepID=UPI001EF2F3F5|nr:hypothetical protein [Candidatus Nitrotoga sp. HW29]CAH1906475.1 conserved hypothetical protein [Candidatus Nitrotoga sp. HW29]
MATYLRTWFFTLLILLTAAVALNYWVDPYGLYRPYREGDWKPYGAAQGELIKPYLVLKHSPRTLILGNSRAEVGFDPEDTAWPESAQPIYNLALPGTGIRVARRLFEHVLAAAHPPQTIVLGVDFMDFLVSPDVSKWEPEIIHRLLITPDGQINNKRWLQMMLDGATTLASLNAMLHSINTVRMHGKTEIAHLTATGFNPMHDYSRIARDEGYFNLFRQRDIENMRVYQKRPKNLFSRGTHTSPAFDDVTAILNAAHAHGIQVKVVIYPYHAHLLEIFRITNCWDIFEDWKRELTLQIANHSHDQVTLWDFSGYHRYAREIVPPVGDKQTVVPDYWEAGHFKKELGHQILSRLSGADEADFGVVLTPRNIDIHLLAIRQDSVKYKLERSAEISQLEELIQ